MRRIDLTGHKFGTWTVLKFVGGKPQSKWLCVCVCGIHREVTGANLRSGHSKSCGVCTRSAQAHLNALNRNNKGEDNPRAKKTKLREGTSYLITSDIWYKRAAGIYYSARKRGVPVGFKSAMEFASYVKAIAPKECPVFSKPFVGRGVGFSPWSPSIDKIDPHKGYIRGNVQVISMLANAMKRNATPTQLRQFAKWVLNTQEVS